MLQIVTMNVKHQLALIIMSFVFVCFSCKKSSNSNTTSVSTSTIANIDSLEGTYSGTTSVDSIYTYTDSTGKTEQWVRSFTWPDTLTVTATDTVSITVVSKFYSVTFPYYDSLTFDYITDLQNTTAQNGYLAYNATLIDTTSVASLLDVNHLLINVGYGYNKYYYSNFVLYRR